MGGAYVHHVTWTRGPSQIPGLVGNGSGDAFQMVNRFEPIPTVESWQLSNASILAMAPLRASLDVIDRAGGIAAFGGSQSSRSGIWIVDWPSPWPVGS
ncbi:MAG: hypothetical protein Ct9H300mP12_09500 [Acidimicrobiales bacterium]|nr:MAG: hypothetical protein Ct9H300mP12_09500 [Acidimicrobiales bacterium]